MERTAEQPDETIAAPIQVASIKRSGFDRRVGEERRATFDLDYFDDHLNDRRSKKNRRLRAEKRKGWVRITSWTSVCSLFADRVLP